MRTFIMMVLDKLARQTNVPAYMLQGRTAAKSFTIHQQTAPRYTGLQKPSRTSAVVSVQSLLQGTDPTVAAYNASLREGRIVDVA